jgi:hypothetical protein
MIGYLAFRSVTGATFSEVLVAMALTSVGLVATMGAFQAAHQQFGRGVLATRAMHMAESRLEAKRAVRWDQLLMEDLDQNGLPKSFMHDDGTAGDRVAGDGIYSDRIEQNGVTLIWTVAPNHGGNLALSGYVVIEVRASYRFHDGEHELRLATLRANAVLAAPH